MGGVKPAAEPRFHGLHEKKRSILYLCRAPVRRRFSSAASPRDKRQKHEISTLISEDENSSICFQTFRFSSHSCSRLYSVHSAIHRWHTVHHKLHFPRRKPLRTHQINQTAASVRLVTLVTSCSVICETFAKATELFWDIYEAAIKIKAKGLFWRGTKERLKKPLSHRREK